MTPAVPRNSGSPAVVILTVPPSQTRPSLLHDSGSPAVVILTVPPCGGVLGAPMARELTENRSSSPSAAHFLRMPGRHPAHRHREQGFLAGEPPTVAESSTSWPGIYCSREKTLFSMKQGRLRARKPCSRCSQETLLPGNPALGAPGSLHAKETPLTLAPDHSSAPCTAFAQEVLPILTASIPTVADFDRFTRRQARDTRSRSATLPWGSATARVGEARTLPRRLGGPQISASGPMGLDRSP